MTWDQWIKTAVLGTDRGPDLPGESREESVLREIARQVVVRKAARPLPSRQGESFAYTAPPPAATSTGSEVGEWLGQILSGHFEPALEEGIQLLLRSGTSIPPYLLPAVLEEAIRRPWLFDQLFGRLPAGAAWVARLKPRWRVLAPEPGTPWSAQSTTEQSAVLRYLRQQGEPEEAEARYAHHAGDAPWQARREWLRAWDHGLRAGDQPFLESRLGDSRKEVRQVAARLLLRLPDSDLSRRLTGDLASAFNRSGSPVGLTKLFHSDPWKSLGLFTGSRHELLQQLGRHIAPACWADLLGTASFQSALERMSARKEGKLLLQGLLANDVLTDAKWVSTLFGHLRDQGPADWLDWKNLDRFLRRVPEAEIQNGLQVYLRQSSGWVEDESLPARILGLGAHRLDDHSAIVIVRHVQAHFLEDGVPDWRSWHYRHLLRQCAYLCPPPVFRKLQRGWEKVAESWQREKDHFLRIIAFRQRMHESLANAKTHE